MPVSLEKIKHEVVQAQSENQKVEVAVRAIKNTWIQVKTDDNVVFQMTLSKGSMESWSADSKIELSGRNIEQLDMEVNGKHIGSLGGGERRIRKVVDYQGRIDGEEVRTTVDFQKERLSAGQKVGVINLGCARNLGGRADDAGPP